MIDPKTVLVVEDDRDSNHALCLILEKLGFAPISFHSAEEALASLDADPRPLLVALIDVMMPKMNGIELIAELRRRTPYSALPAIVVTARDADDDLFKGYARGADYYITKPYTVSQIESGIRLFIKGE